MDRRDEGRTPKKRTQGTGNPTHSLEDRTNEELYNRAKDLDISGRGKMKKEDLVNAIRQKQLSSASETPIG